MISSIPTGIDILSLMHRSYRLVISLAIVSGIAAIAAVFLVLQLIDTMSAGANRFDEEKTKQAIHASFEGLLDQETALVTDNAKWDDAVVHSYGTADMEWFANTWGYASANGSSYDGVYIVESDGRTLSGYDDGKAIATSAEDLLGSSLQKTMAHFDKGDSAFRAISNFQLTKKGLSIVAVAPIMFATEGKTIPSATPRYLIFTRTLTPQVLTDIGQRMIVTGLQLAAETASDSPRTWLANGDGKAAAYLTWQADRPGDLVRSAIQNKALAILAGVLSCVLMFIGLSTFFARRLQASQREAWKTAHSDFLTGLSNRQGLQDYFAKTVKTPGATNNLVVMLLDIDGFKDVNDCYGHDIGDGLMRLIATGMKSIGNKYDAHFSRLGGDEFAVVLNGADCQSKSPLVMKSLFDLFIEPFEVLGRVAKVGISVGVSHDPQGATSTSELMRQADVAMYVAKAQGKGCAVFYQPSLDAERNNRVDMAKHLAKAIEERRIEVAYQPVVDAKTRQITGVEALARWQLTPGKFIPPDKFVAVAEEFGLIDRLGAWVLEIACKQAAEWQDLHLAVNISPVQFRNPNFVETVCRIVDSAGLKRNLVELEVTEGHIIQNSVKAKETIDTLRAAGFAVALDDFGVGYSSLGYLRDYKFDRLKIDKSLISGMTTDHSTLSIVHAAAAMARSLNMLVTAEGVEQEEEANLLHLAGCNSLQGYHTGRPQTASAINALLNHNDEAKVG
jgi:diguanylate cyclase (GGDEF)-like protein